MEVKLALSVKWKSSWQPKKKQVFMYLWERGRVVKMDTHRLRCLAGFPSLPRRNIPCLGMTGHARRKANAWLPSNVVLFRACKCCCFLVFLALGNTTKVWGNVSNVNGQNSYKDNIWKTEYGFISRSLSCCPMQHDLCGHLTATHPIPPPLQERRYFWSLVSVSIRTSMFPAMKMRVVSSSSCRFARRPLS